MADEKSIVKMNKMIHKKTGASFLVVYVIYISLVYTDSKKTTCTHTERFISVPLCSGQSELASICLFVQFNPIRPGLFSRSPGPGGLRGPDAKNQG